MNQTLAKSHQAIVKSLSNGGFVLAMTLAAACWGAGAVMSKGVLGYLPPLTLLVVQLVASLTFLWAVVAVQRIRVPLRRETFRLGLIGLLNPGLAYTFSLLGLSLTTASMSALLWAAEPVLILGLAWFILRERLTPALLACSLLAIAGVFLVIGVNAGMDNSGSFSGNLLILAGVLCCALYTVLTRRDAATLDPVLLVALQQTAALLWALLIWPLELGTSLTAISLSAWLWAVASGIVYYALAFWFYITGLKRIPASLAGLFLNLIPIFAVGGAYLFLGERLAAVQWIGAALILAAVMTMLRFQNRENFLKIERLQSENVTGVG
ncbi:MAG: DMT family transporter [Anaerolineae bacterium]|nr:DMT family transporter [Anaerolineae bacterium]